MNSGDTGDLMKNIRKIVFVFSGLLALVIYFYWATLGLTYNIVLLRLTQTYAFTSFIFLYASLLISPLYQVFKNLPGKLLAKRARRAIGVNSFLFALLHSSLGFFGLLGGFNGLGFLSNNYIYGISLGLAALIILFLLALTSFDLALRKLGKSWYHLHRFIYIAGIIILVHSTSIGSHFQDLSSLIPLIIYTASAVLFILEAIRVDFYLSAKQSRISKFRPGLAVAVISALVFAWFLYPDSNIASSLSPLSIHSGHSSKNDNVLVSNLSLDLRSKLGDLNSVYWATPTSPQNISIGKVVNLQFRIENVATQNYIDPEEALAHKQVYLFVIDSNQSNPQIVYPNNYQKTDQDQLVFTVNFPVASTYRMYLNYKPDNAVDQQFVFLKEVGIGDGSIDPLQTNLTQIDSAITNKPRLNIVDYLSESNINRGQNKFQFESGNENSVDLSQSQMILVNTGFQFVHVYKNFSSSTEAEFTPFSLKKPIQKGVYKTFLCTNSKPACLDYSVNVT